MASRLVQTCFKPFVEVSSRRSVEQTPKNVLSERNSYFWRTNLRSDSNNPFQDFLSCVSVMRHDRNCKRCIPLQYIRHLKKLQELRILQHKIAGHAEIHPQSNNVLYRDQGNVLSSTLRPVLGSHQTLGGGGGRYFCRFFFAVFNAVLIARPTITKYRIIHNLLF